LIAQERGPENHAILQTQHCMQVQVRLAVVALRDVADQAENLAFDSPMRMRVAHDPGEYEAAPALLSTPPNPRRIGR